MDIYWLEATPWDYVTNQAVSVRVCSADLSLAAFFSGAEWIPVMDGGPTFSTSVFTGSFTGASDSTRGSVNLLTGAGEIDVWARFNWASRPVKIYGSTIDLASTIAPALGPVNLLFDGHAESFDPDEATLFLRTILPVGLLASTSFAGTGGLEGPVGLANTKKPFSIGKHRNRPPVLINAGKLTFQCNASGRLEELIAVRERGIILDQPFIAQPSFAALDAATVPATEIHYHLASGCFRIGFTPQGDITADYRGAMTGQPYPATVPAIIRQALLWSGWDAGKIDEETLNNVATALPYEAQIHDESGTDIAEALTSIMAGCGGYWDVDPFGIFYIGLFQMAATEDFSVGDEGLANYDLLETDFLPTRAMFWSNRVGFEQNPVVMTFAQTDSVGATPEQLALIKDAIDTADGKVDIFFQKDEPTGAAVGDLWYDTDTMFWYRFEPNGQWLLTQDAGIGIAITDAAGAQATADGKITSYSSETQPVSPALGDLWVKPSEVPRVVRRWTGLIWDTVSTVGADINSNVYDGSGGAAAIVPRSEIRTPLGTAAAIAGQGPAATAPRDAVYNDVVTIRPDGALIGAGGGQVSYGGLGGMALGLLDFLFFGSARLLEQAGGAIASLANFKTFLGTAAGILGQGFGATAAQKLIDNSYVPVGTNTQIDSGFARTSATWSAVGASSAGYMLEFNRADYSGKRSVAYLWHGGTPAAGEICDAVGLGKWTNRPNADMMRYNLPVKLGDVVAVRVLAGNHRCIAQLYLLVFDNAGSLITAPNTSVGAIPGGGVGGDNLGEMQVVIGISQPNAAYAQLMVRMAMDGQPNPYLFFSEPWIGKLESLNSSIPAYAPGPADPVSDQTGVNTAAGFFGQGAFATQSTADFFSQIVGTPRALQPSAFFGSGFMQAGEIYHADGARNLGTWFPEDVSSNRTENRTASAFSGQGAFATQSFLALGNGAFFQADGRFAPSPQHGGSYFAASAVAFAAGETTESLRPEEAGGNRTETRTAAAFVSQGVLATKDNVFIGSQSGRSYGLLTQNGFGTSDPQLITDQGTSAALSGQGTLATQDVVRLGTPSGRLGGLVSEGNAYWITDAVAVTSQGTASAFAGQGALATRSNVSYGDGYTFGFNYLATQTSVSFNTTTIRRADGSTSVSETLVVTELGVAAAFVGQGRGATSNSLGDLDPDAKAQLDAVAGGGSRGVKANGSVTVYTSSQTPVSTSVSLVAGKVRVSLSADNGVIDLVNGGGTAIIQITVALGGTTLFQGTISIDAFDGTLDTSGIAAANTTIGNVTAGTAQFTISTNKIGGAGFPTGHARLGYVFEQV